MRKWLLFAAGVVVVGATVVVGQVLNQGGNEKAPEGAVPQKTAKSRIVKVTVYPHSALVTREVEVPEGSGLTELVVSSMPVRIGTDSLYSESSNGIRVLSTRFRSREVFEDTREDVRKAQDEIKTLRLTAEKLMSDIASLKQNMMMVTKLEDFTTRTTVHSTEKGGLNGDTVITLSNYLMKQREEKAKELVRLDQELQANKEQVEFAKRKMSQLTQGPSKTERDAIIVIDRDKSVQGAKVRLNYLVDAVSWKSQYKLRSGKNGDPVQIDYLASVMQHTGEDWNQVALSLSTTEPMLNAAPPDLKRLEVVVVPQASLPPMAQNLAPDAGRPMPTNGFGAGMGGMGGMAQLKLANSLREQATNSYKNKDLASGAKALNEAAALEQGNDLMKSRAEVQQGQRQGQNKNINFVLNATGGGIEDGPSVTYNLGQRLSVPSRPDEQIVEVAKLKLAPKYYYKAVPVLSRSVYRLADLINDSDTVLLPGEATMYQGTDFVGRMRMPLVAVGEEFTAGFGVDPQLQIQRQMVDKDRKTQGGNQVLKYEYRILVSSYKKEPVKVQVWDRLPLASETESAGVILAKVTPEVSKDAIYLREQRPNNLLRWDLEVGPTMNGENALTINYEFRIELDKQKVINSVTTR